MFFLKKIFQKKLNVDEIEDLLFENGVEPKFAELIISKIKDNTSKEEDVKKVIKKELLTKFAEKKFGGFSPQSKSLYIIAGNNGSGKTTFIGKFINLFQKNGLNPAVIAADTFRAAAIDQLEHFTKKFEVPIHKGNNMEDPSAVIFQGIDKMKENDVVIIDTSGRQHNNKNLMAELKKISNIISKKSDQFNLIQTFLTLDANTGLASKHIIEGFREYITLDGIILNKVDSNAKYGALLTIINDFDIPVVFEGYGEGMSDLREFQFEEYLDRLI
ncbi:zeta toxin family protein [Alphaproteobacteria bacterium]|nr:zeta toxin family protein [Alphaproteobacteria bacterium]